MGIQVMQHKVPRRYEAHGGTIISLIESKATPPSLKDEKVGENTLKTFDLIAYTGGKINLDGVDFPVIFDLASMKVLSSTPLLHSHNRDRVVGHAENIKISVSGGVTGKGILSVDNAWSKEIKDAAGNGFPWQLSIGLEKDKVRFVKAGENVKVNGKDFVGPLFVAYNGTLREISFLPVGADGNTKAVLKAAFPTPSNGDTSMKTFEEWLAELKLDPATLSDEAKAILQKDYDEWVKSQDATANANKDKTANANADLRLYRAAFVNERKRIDRINELDKEYGNPKDKKSKILIAAQAIEEDWTVEKTEVEMMKAARPVINAGGSGRYGGSASNGFDAKLFTAALAQAGKLSDKTLTKQFDNQTLDAAHKKYRSRIGLQEFLMEAAYASGYDGSRNFKADLRNILKAAFSTLEVPQILAVNTNNFLLEGFNGVDQTWRLIAKITSVPDFKENTSYRGVGSFTFEQIAADGLIPHGSMEEMDYGNKVDTFAKMFAITRQDIINDNLGVFNDVPKQLGRGGALKLNRIFWIEFLDNSTFFHANYANVTTGALGIAGLSNMFATFGKLKGPDGEFLLHTLKYLLVPLELLPTAETLASSRQLNNGSTTATASDNPWVNKFTPITSPYLSDSTIPGYSATAYYGLADPNDIPVIEVAFLDGQETPIVETADVDFNRLGIQMRGYYDFGVRKQEQRGGVRSTGV